MSYEMCVECESCRTPCGVPGCERAWTSALRLLLLQRRTDNVRALDTRLSSNTASMIAQPPTFK